MNHIEQRIFRQILKSEFEKIRGKNPAYSQRAFAKKLGLNSGTLNGFLQNKRIISSKASREILTRLKLDNDFHEWISNVLDKKNKNSNIEIERTLLDLDRFSIIANPVHLNALNLLRTTKAEHNKEWLAKKLKLSEAEITGVIERLQRAELLKKSGDKLIPTKKPIKTPDNFPHKAIRSFHKNTLAEATNAIDNVPVELRDFSSITITADPAKIEQVRELIKNFRDQVSFLLGSSPGSEVYKLSVQFFPITHEENQ